MCLLIALLGKGRATGGSRAAAYLETVSEISAPKAVCDSHKKMLRTANSYGFWRLEAFRILSLYYWMINNQAKAINWWSKSIKEAERMKGRPHLARIYKDIGIRFLEAKSKYKEMNGITAEQYLEKARKMFEEMDLQWDLDELDKVMASSVRQVNVFPPIQPVRG